MSRTHDLLACSVVLNQLLYRVRSVLSCSSVNIRTALVWLLGGKRGKLFFYFAADIYGHCCIA